MIRGRELEKRIESVFDQLNSTRGDILCIRLEVKRVNNGSWIKKQPFDYLVASPKGIFAFDAKECAGDRFYLSSVPLHQRESLLRMQNLGHRAGLVVWFKKWRGHPKAIRFIENLLERHVTVDDGIAFDWDMLG